MSALTYAITLLQTLPAILGASENLLTFVQQQVIVLQQMEQSGQDPSDAQWDALHAQIASLRSGLA